MEILEGALGLANMLVAAFCSWVVLILGLLQGQGIVAVHAAWLTWIVSGILDVSAWLIVTWLLRGGHLTTVLCLSIMGGTPFFVAVLLCLCGMLPLVACLLWLVNLRFNGEK